MSYWTYIQGIIIVSPNGRTQHEKEYVLKTVLDHLPRVAGSEGPMQICINPVTGYDSSSNHDEFFNHSNLGEGRRCRMFHHTDEYLLTLNGYLRDMELGETQRAFAKWIHRLAKRIHIENCLVRIQGYEKDVIITNNNDYYSDLYEWDENWTDYLMWENQRDEEGNLIGGKPESKRRKVWNNPKNQPWEFGSRNSRVFVIPVELDLGNGNIVIGKFNTHLEKYFHKDTDVTNQVKAWKYI